MLTELVCVCFLCRVSPLPQFLSAESVDLFCRFSGPPLLESLSSIQFGAFHAPTQLTSWHLNSFKSFVPKQTLKVCIVMRTMINGCMDVNSPLSSFIFAFFWSI